MLWYVDGLMGDFGLPVHVHVDGVCARSAPYADGLHLAFTTKSLHFWQHQKNVDWAQMWARYARQGPMGALRAQICLLGYPSNKRSFFQLGDENLVR